MAIYNDNGFSDSYYKERYYYLIRNADLDRLATEKSKLASLSTYKEKYDYLNKILKYEENTYRIGQEIPLTDLVLEEPGYYKIIVKGASGGSSKLNNDDDKYIDYSTNAKYRNFWIKSFTNKEAFLYITKDFYWYLIIIQDGNLDIHLGKIECQPKRCFLFRTAYVLGTEFCKEYIKADQAKSDFGPALALIRNKLAEDTDAEEKMFITKNYEYFDYIEKDWTIIETDDYNTINLVENNLQFKYDNFVDSHNNSLDYYKFVEGFYPGFPYIYEADNFTKIKKTIDTTNAYAEQVDEYNKLVEKWNTNETESYRLIKHRCSFERDYKIPEPGETGGYITEYFKLTKGGVRFSYNVSGKSKNEPFQNTNTFISLDNVDIITAVTGRNRDGFKTAMSNNSDVFTATAYYPDFEDVNQNVCRKGTSKTHEFTGGGGLGRGIRTNKYGNTYYDDGEDGSIYIQYLGPMSSVTAHIKFDLTNCSVSCCKNGDVLEIPVGSDFEFKLRLDSKKNYLKFSDSGFNDDVFKASDRLIGYVTDENGKLLANEQKTTTLREEYVKEIKETFEKMYGNLSTNLDSKFFTITREPEADYYYVKFRIPEFFGNSEEVVFTLKSEEDLAGYRYDTDFCSNVNTGYFVFDDGIDNFRNKFSKVAIGDVACKFSGSYKYDLMSRYLDRKIYTSHDTDAHLQVFSGVDSYNRILSTTEYFEFSVLAKNKITLSKKTWKKGLEWFNNENIGYITYIKFCDTQPSSDSDLQDIVQAKKYAYSRGAKIYLKIGLSSPRIQVDELLSSINKNYIKCHEQNYNLYTSSIDELKEDGEIYQWIEICLNTSVNLELFIEKLTYTTQILSDCFLRMTTNINGLNVYEPYEKISFSFNQDIFEKLSLLPMVKPINYVDTSSDVLGEVYSVTELLTNKSYNLFETFFIIENEDNKNFCNIYPEITTAPFTSLFENTYEEIASFFSNYSKSAGTFKLYQPKSNIIARLTTDIKYMSLFSSVGSSSFEKVNLMKTSINRLLLTSPHSGNGGNAANGTSTTWDTTAGGCGGDGFRGGSSGVGDTTNSIEIEPKLVTKNVLKGIKIPIGFKVEIYTGIPSYSGLNGYGFLPGTPCGLATSYGGAPKSYLYLYPHQLYYSEDGYSLYYVDPIRGGGKGVYNNFTVWDGSTEGKAFRFIGTYIDNYTLITADIGCQLQIFTGTIGNDGVTGTSTDSEDHGNAYKRSGSGGCAGSPSAVYVKNGVFNDLAAINMNKSTKNGGSFVNEINKSEHRMKFLPGGAKGMSRYIYKNAANIHHKSGQGVSNWQAANGKNWLLWGLKISLDGSDKSGEFTISPQYYGGNHVTPYGPKTDACSSAESYYKKCKNDGATLFETNDACGAKVGFSVSASQQMMDLAMDLDNKEEGSVYITKYMCDGSDWNPGMVWQNYQSVKSGLFKFSDGSVWPNSGCGFKMKYFGLPEDDATFCSGLLYKTTHIGFDVDFSELKQKTGELQPHIYQTYYHILDKDFDSCLFL